MQPATHLPTAPESDAPDAPDAPATLVAAAQAGSVAAFESLYRAHVGRVHAVCLRLTADREQAAQLTQDAFVRAWERLATFRGESRFDTWLHRLAVNVVLDARRRRGRLDRREVTSDEPEVLEAAALGHATAAPAVAERLDLERAIAALPEGARTAFVLHEVEGYPLKEIAAASGIAEGTVKSQLWRARQILQEALR